MTSQQQFLDAAADFAGLIADGADPKSALQDAGRTNGVDPAVLEKRLTANEDLEAVVERIREMAKNNALHAAIVIETKNYWKNMPKNAGLGWIFNRDHTTSLIKSAVETRLGRPIDNAEEGMIRDRFFEVIQGRFA